MTSLFWGDIIKTIKEREKVPMKQYNAAMMDMMRMCSMCKISCAHIAG